MTFEPIVLVMSVFSLLLGIGMHLWLGSGRGQDDAHSTRLVSWLLIALFPVLLIFSFFPNSEFSGNIKGVSTGGAIGAFILIWWSGTKAALKAAETDQADVRLRSKDNEIAELRQRLQVSEKIVKPQVLSETRIHRYRLVANPTKAVALVTGNLSKVDFVDAWVNSENTNMQMASYFDRSVSGTIRYLGARRDPNTGYVVEDLVANELSKKMGSNLWVLPGTVFVTDPGELAATNNVKRILHVAAVQGQPGVGYRPIENISCCVENALKAAEAESSSEMALSSLVFPLLGAGQGRGNIEATAKELFCVAIDYLTSHPHGHVKTVYFLTYTDAELAACRQLLDHLEGVVRDDQH